MRGYAPERMRANGIAQVLTWRWAPCAALILGSLSFVGFVSLAIPDRIGEGKASTGNGSSLGSHLSRTQSPTGVQATADWSGESGSDEPLRSSSQVARAGTNAASRLAGMPAKRGFTPPLDRPAQAAPAVVQAPPEPPPQPPPAAPAPAAEAATPAPTLPPPAPVEPEH